MPRAVHNDVLDAALNVIKNACTAITFCAGQPTTYAEATTTPGAGGKALVQRAAIPGDFTLADGATGGRSLTSAELTDTVDVTGTGDHVAFVDAGTSRLLYVTTASSQPVTAGGSFAFPPIEINLGDPVAL